MIQRKIHISLKIVLLSSVALFLVFWLILRWNRFRGPEPESPWLEIPESALIERAEKDGKRILFLVEPISCSDCESIRKKFESAPRIAELYLFSRIGETQAKERYESILLDDRFSEKVPLLAEGKGFWGIRNGSDEILYLSQGIFGEAEERILLESASAQNKNAAPDPKNKPDPE
ncbi:hypothetical protein CH379_011895 [Leptospira ellisii]|uniref:Thioredoxin family protein n=1 Tax=Leptospira ellisii TaxID=2023197 RepID=A0A2N0BMJ7_9LEPT|nr:hypothetical protein [Leptospira ellisii]MDV6236328.1 hypothetical protein [Leptospira ellisii]PJZ94931.1 hypothetical protein CH379_00205 [Leptospira ellisii]PKA05219.1 hypothetical protein CH375_06365 [Leptospira ellisii]